MNESGLARHMWLLAAATIVLSMTGACSPPSSTMAIYFIDVEGGQATLMVMPGGESLLVDTGFPGDNGNARDAERIVAAAADAGISRIDYLLVTHFHADHFGGAAALSRLLPIGSFIDHDTAAPETLATDAAVERFEAYKLAREKARHIVPSAGDRLPLQSVEATVVSTDRLTVSAPLTGGGGINGACDRPVLAAVDAYENPRSTGVLIQFGKFRFLDLGDLSGQPLSDLVCPDDRIGPVDVYLVPHHGGADVADPATLTAFQPSVAILNNGAMKGGEVPIFGFLRAATVQDVWQLHRSEVEGAENFADENIANFDEQTAHWIKLTAHRDGSFRIQNGRTGLTKDYDPK